MKKRMHANSLAAFDATDELRSERQEQVYALLLLQPMTDRELMTALGFTDPNMVRPRVTELVDAFWAVEIGRVEDPQTGKNVRRTRALTSEKRAALIAERRHKLAQDFPKVEQPELCFA